MPAILIALVIVALWIKEATAAPPPPPPPSQEEEVMKAIATLLKRTKKG